MDRGRFFKSCRSKTKSLIQDKAKSRLSKHLDIVEILRKQIMIEALLKMKLGKLERFFLKRNHRFVIDSSWNTASNLFDDSGEDSYHSAGDKNGVRNEETMIKHLAKASHTKD